ncbi:hypothetical protein VTN49DRAFT_7116 [Thermomyces lanuginosus]|uniref:uncharacterized protein n=1 Tax=Thermomyces lanuginosus TaxID=5541 RepID=UPI00374450CB
MDLTSHHVNYLIWRYLQESGHGEAAVMLQRAWNPNPQSLPFAPYIRNHALVSLVQKGLQYHEIEQSLDQDGNPVPMSPSKSFFGPAPFDLDSYKPPEENRQDQVQGLSEAEQQRSPSPAKGRRPSHATNGLAAAEPSLGVKKVGKDATNGDGGAMDIEVNGVNHDQVMTPGIKSQSPSEPAVDVDGDVAMGTEAHEDQDPAAPPITYTLTEGKSIGVQSTAKTPDLGACTSTVDLNVGRPDHVIMSTWRPYDSSIFAAASESVCGLWKLPGLSDRATAAPVHERIFDSHGDGSWVTALAWHPSGDKLAVAVYGTEHRGSIQMFDAEGNAVDILPDAPGMIVGLHWAPRGSTLLVVVSIHGNSELTLWDDSLKSAELSADLVIDGEIFDATWAGNNQLFVAGSGFVTQCDTESGLRIVNKFESRTSSTEWSFVRGTRRAFSAVAVAVSSSATSIWVPTHDMLLEDIHDGDITAAEIRPEPLAQEAEASSSLILATSSIDDTLRVWNVNLQSKEITNIHTLSLVPKVPVLTLAFSPDGYAVSAATVDAVAIWNVDRGGVPLATWTAPGAREAKKATTNGDVQVENMVQYRCLAWDSDSKRLIMGYGSQMAVIDIQRRATNGVFDGT